MAVQRLVAVAHPGTPTQALGTYGKRCDPQHIIYYHLLASVTPPGTTLAHALGSRYHHCNVLWQANSVIA